MPTFPVPCGIFAGMTQQQLQTALSAAQSAYQQLMTGAKAVTLSYAQGDGTKSITYTQASVANLTQYIMQLNQALGNCCGRRRPMRFIFR